MKTLFRPLRLVLILPAIVLLIACTEQLSHIQPVDLSGVAGEVKGADTIDQDAIVKAKAIEQSGTVAASPISVSLEQDTEQIKVRLDKAEKSLLDDQIAISKITNQANHIADKYTALEISDSKKSTRILQLWIALGALLALDVIVFVLHCYWTSITTSFPFLKLI